MFESESRQAVGLPSEATAMLASTTRVMSSPSIRRGSERAGEEVVLRRPPPSRQTDDLCESGVDG